MLQGLCCKFFNENFDKTFPCCTNGNNLAITALDFDNESDQQEEEEKTCCPDTIDGKFGQNTTENIDRFFIKLPEYNTLKSASFGFYNLFNKIDRQNDEQITMLFNITNSNHDEIVKLRNLVEQLMTILAEKLFTTSLAETTTISVPSVGSSENETSDFTIYILIACILVLSLTLVVSSGFLIYNRIATRKSTLNSIEKCPKESIVDDETPEYEYIRHHDNQVVSNIHFSSIFPTIPKIDSNLNINEGICHNSESNHSIQISSIYNEAFDAVKHADDSNDFYSQITQIDVSKTEVSQINKTSNLYAKI